MRLTPLLAIATLACSEVAQAPLTMDGNWRQSGDLRDVSTGDGHIHLGTFTLAQRSDATFDGTGQQTGFCARPDGVEYQGPLVSGNAFPVLEGQIRGDSVEFRTDLCHFVGTFTDSRRVRMTGIATCAYRQDGQEYTFEGQWQADR